MLLVGLLQQKAEPVDNLRAQTYALPPAEIQNYFDQPRHLNYLLTNLSSDKKWFARVVSEGQTRLSDISNPYENFAGIMLDTKANRARTLSYRAATKIQLTSAIDFSTKEIKAPANTWLSSATWSPNGKRLMYLVHTPEQSTVWVLDAESGKNEPASTKPLLASSVTPDWSGDSNSILGVFVPESRVAEPVYTSYPKQPRVQVSDPTKNKLRTYRSLLLNKTDCDRFEYFMTGQLAKIDLATKVFKAVGKPAMYVSIDCSPKGDLFRVQTLQKPFSYIVPASNFGRKEEILEESGKSLTVLNEVKLREGDTGDTPPPTPAKRNIAWAPDGSGLIFIRNQPKTEKKEEPKVGGETFEFPLLTAHMPTETGWEDEQGRGQNAAAAAAATQEPEELVSWKAPFEKENETVLIKRKNGFVGLQFNQSGTAIFVTDSEAGTSSTKRITLDKDPKEEVLWSVKPREQSPGTIILSLNSFGVSSIDETSGTLLLRGVNTTQNEEKDPTRPFLNAFDIASKKVSKVWQCEEQTYQTVDAILDAKGNRIVVNHQTPTETPNSFLVENGKRSKALTNNIDYAPDLSQAKKMRIQVTRADGFKFWVKVTVPTWKLDGVKLPAFFWFYPSEFENQEAYDRGTRPSNPYQFAQLGGSPKTLLLRRGWALVEPDCPIVGPKGRINDFYVNDLRNSLSAVVDTLDAQGIADRTKLAIGGHSYGGFSTANAMINTPFFKAGIAGAGNYNRTLTPLSFQTETRTLWESRSTYLDMSPILYAENLSGAMLMYAGMDDQNVGTDPVNSIRMFNVLESIGKTTALYMYPYEDHGQVARETLMDQWARWIPWLDKYVLGK